MGMFLMFGAYSTTSPLPAEHRKNAQMGLLSMLGASPAPPDFPNIETMPT